MGEIYECNCKKCEYKFTYYDGLGFRFPYEYRKTVSLIKDGKYGEEAKKFFEENEYAAVNVNPSLTICDECKEYVQMLDLGLYLPKDGYVPSNKKTRWNAGDAEEIKDYVTSYDLTRHYKRILSIKQYCPTCGKEIKKVSNLQQKIRKRKMKCPKCNEEMSIDFGGFWD